MVDIFLMGTVGQSQWREPIKEACARMGVVCFDPVVPVWNDEAKRREAEALETAHVIVMAITADTASIASLAESGWVALSALKRNQAFGLYVDPIVADLDDPRGSKTGLTGWVLDTFFGGRERQQANDTLEEASQRARKLVISHVARLTDQFPGLRVHIAGSLNDLQDWAIATARRMAQQAASRKPNTSQVD
jgi:hypothetical protein